MKMVMIAALLVAPFSAAASPAHAAELPREDLVAQERGASAGARLREGVELDLREGQAAASHGGSAAESRAAADAQEEQPRKKRKSTGDKVLTGAAVILGVGALAVGGLLIAIFVG